MPPNGPAIKGVSVAERVEAGAVLCHRGRVLVPAGKSEAWRGFCRQVASFLSFTSVAVQGLLRAGHLSPYTSLVESSGAITVMSPYTVILLTAGTGCKNRDKSYNLYCPCYGALFINSNSRIQQLSSSPECKLFQYCFPPQSKRQN
jgi:hypothetical protein